MDTTKFNENNGMRIMQPGETPGHLDPDRVVECDGELVAQDVPADISQGSLGGVDFLLNVDGHPAWRKKVRLILKPKPEHMTKAEWQAAVDLVVQQSEQIQ